MEYKIIKSILYSTYYPICQINNKSQTRSLNKFPYKRFARYNVFNLNCQIFILERILAYICNPHKLIFMCVFFWLNIRASYLGSPLLFYMLYIALLKPLSFFCRKKSGLRFYAGFFYFAE